MTDMVTRIIEIALGSLVAVIAIGALSEKSDWFSKKLKHYTGGAP